MKINTNLTKKIVTLKNNSLHIKRETYRDSTVEYMFSS